MYEVKENAQPLDHVQLIISATSEHKQIEPKFSLAQSGPSKTILPFRIRQNGESKSNKIGGLKYD